MKHIILGLSLIIFAACGTKDKKSETIVTDSTGNQTSQANVPVNTDTTLATAKPFIDKELQKWAQSFNRFHIDSFKWQQRTDFESLEYEKSDDLNTFYGLYKNSLNYSPDSSQFLDLYSYGLWLEKKGNRIIASADVDNGITLNNLRTKEWKRILFFGPSAWIEEAVWVSPTVFVLAGIFNNDNGENEAFLMLGNTNDRSFHWFKSNAIRPQSSKYEASGMAKLKIDEWE